MGSAPVADDRPLETRDALLDYFPSGGKPPEQWGIGIEYERVGVIGPRAEALPYFGDVALSHLLSAIAERPGWTAIREDGNIIELQRESCRITLEPGGQLELAGAIHRTLGEARCEVDAFVRRIAELSSEHGITWLGLGMTPTSTPADIAWVPKSRYGIMSERLAEQGELSHWMMKTTAGVQVNFDYADEADAIEKLRVITRATSTITALFANSPISSGVVNGYDSYRAHVWQHTDPDRCGLQTFLLRPEAGFEQMLDHALDVPMMFIIRDGRWLDTGRMPFRRFIDTGLDGHRATFGDWELHVSTLFPEARLKRHLEVRGADSGSPEQAVALAALWTGLLYDADARAAVLELFQDVDEAEHQRAHVEAPRLGLGARTGDRTLLDLGAALVEIGARGLSRWDPDGDALLDPVRRTVDRGVSPARELLELWRGPWQGDVGELVRFADTAPSEDA